MSEAKTIFITGAASGIGREVAVYFARRGWFVGLTDINEAGLLETAAMLPEGMSSIHMLDVRSRERWEAALADFAAKTGGKMHVMFNNAGVGIGGLLEEHTAEEIDLLIDINFKGVVLGAQLAYPYLKATPESCLLNTSSAAGIYGSSGLCVYSATKFAVRGLTEALDVEWSPDGIRVRALMPSFIDTPLLNRVNRKSNTSGREAVVAAGLELSKVEIVAEAAWNAVHDAKTVKHYVGPTAKKMAFAAKWMPGRVRKQGLQMAEQRRGLL